MGLSLASCPQDPVHPGGGRCRQPRAEVCARFYYPTSTLTDWSSRPFLPPPPPPQRNEEEKQKKTGDEAAALVCHSLAVQGWR